MAVITKSAGAGGPPELPEPPEPLLLFEESLAAPPEPPDVLSAPVPREALGLEQAITNEAVASASDPMNRSVRASSMDDDAPQSACHASILGTAYDRSRDDRVDPPKSAGMRSYGSHQRRLDVEQLIEVARAAISRCSRMRDAILLGR
jgi:hypothetical protein